MAKMSAEVTHNHPEGIRVAQVTAAAIFLVEVFSGVPERLEKASGTVIDGSKRYLAAT